MPVAILQRLRHNAQSSSLVSSFTGTFCVGQFDGWSCFPDTPINTVAKVLCPPVHAFDTSSEKIKLNLTGCVTREDTNSFSYPLIAGFAHKPCESDGNWFRHPLTNRTWTNYTTCIDVGDYEVNSRIKFPCEFFLSFRLFPFLMYLRSYRTFVTAQKTCESHLCYRIHNLVDSDSPIDFYILLL